jgi:hypothetical protein
MSRLSSIFAQIFQLVPRALFDKAVEKHKAERHSRGFTSLGQFVAMLFGQLGQAESLREICNGLRACEGKLRHLGVPEAPGRSTLAYANEHRPWEVYSELYGQLWSLYEAQARIHNRKLRLKNKLVSIDSTSIDLCAEIFDWAHYKKTKGAVKLHLVLEHSGYLPRFAVITDGKGQDVTVGRTFSFEKGTIVAMDRAYVDYDWWRRMTDDGVYFVSRLKPDLPYEVIGEREVPKTGNVVSDRDIRITPVRKDYQLLLRLVTINDNDGREIIFITNQLKFGPTTIARIYKERWQIELFFKALKQLLRVKTFVGTSPNALKTQIWVALIAMLLLKYLHVKSTFQWSFSNMAVLVRQQLFVYRDLTSWLKNPFEAPPALDGIHDGQLALFT